MTARPNAIDPGPRPELAWLPVNMLSVDPTYQRTLEGRLSQASIEKIARNFRWSCFGAALVTESGDGWKIIDGQHRIEAAKRVGMSTVPCIVVPPIGVEEQARIFLSTNVTRVRINTHGLYRARLVAGDARAVACDRMCREAAITIPPRPIPVVRMKPGETLALAVLETIAGDPADRGGRLAVLTVAAAFRTQAGGLLAPVFKGVAKFLRDHPAQAPKVEAWLARQVPAALRRKYFRPNSEADFAADLHRAVHGPLPGAAAASALEPSGIQPPTRAQLMGRRQ